MLAQGALVQFPLVDINSGAAVTPTFINGWFMELSIPTVRTLPGLKPSQQMFLSTVPLRATVPFGWFAQLSEPPILKQPRRLNPGLQQFLADSRQPIVPFSWFAPLSEPRVKTRPRLLPSQQIAVFFHPRPIVDISWFQPLSEPRIKVKLGLRASQQQFLAQPPRVLPTPTITGTMNLVEQGDLALFGAFEFGTPVEARVGVIELSYAPFVSLVELRPKVSSGLIEDRLAPASGTPVTPIASASVGIRVI